MKRKRCQICDGPIANGRCKLCGMPYRNDEVLYHLNESRSDHYGHATDKAQKIMREMEIPLGDKEKKKKQEEMKKEILAQQQKVRQEAVERINTTKVPNAGKAPEKKPAYKRNKKVSSYEKERRRAKKASSWISFIIILAIILFSLAPDIIEYVQEHFGYESVSFFSQEEDYADEDVIHIRDYGKDLEIQEISTEDTQWLEEWLRMNAK